MNIKSKSGYRNGTRWLPVFFTALVLLVASCDGGGSDSGGIPIDLGEIEAEYISNISYGSNALQKFDIFMPSSETTTPLVIFIHGGAFYTGDKDEKYNSEQFEETVTGLLAQGIAVANINYRLLVPILGDTVGVIKCLNDGKRCLQYIRYNASTYNIDKNRVALMGESAGAGTSLWIGLQDDMADSGNADPVLRESTRVNAIAAIESQATYDLVQWDTIFSGYGITIGDFITTNSSGTGMYFLLCAFYALTTQAITNSDEVYDQLDTVTDYRADLDMLSFMDSGDPELFINNTWIPEIPASMGVNEIFHHPLHGKTLMDQANTAGIPNVTYLSMTATGANISDEDIVEFMDRTLNP